MAGLKVKDILNMDIRDFMNYDTRQMRQIVQTLASAANKRLKDFDLKGLESPATRYVKDSGGKFSTKGKNLNNLRNEFARVKAFLQSETGSVRGYRKVQRDTINELKRQGVNLSESNWNAFWKMYERLKQVNPAVANRRFKYVGLREISNRMKDVRNKDISIDNAIADIQAKLESMYTEQEQTHGAGVSEFFEI